MTPPTSVFFTSEISPEGEFFYLWPIFGEIWTQKNIFVAKYSSILTIFIHLNPFSSTFRAFIQHLDELASGYVLVVPPGRKTKNHRKNTASNLSKLHKHQHAVSEPRTPASCQSS
jgi:hypothetical protein